MVAPLCLRHALVIAKERMRRIAIEDIPIRVGLHRVLARGRVTAWCSNQPAIGFIVPHAALDRLRHLTRSTGSLQPVGVPTFRRGRKGGTGCRATISRG